MWPGPRPVAAVVVGALVAALVVRRRRPLTSALATAGVLAAYAVVEGGAESGTAFVLVCLTVYAASAHQDRVRPLVAAVVVEVTCWVAFDSHEHGPGGLAFLTALNLLAYGVGRLVRMRGRQVALLERQAAELEELHQARVAAATAAERALIARELHDIVAHAVSIIVIQAQAGERLLRSGRDSHERVAAILSTIEATGDSASAELARLLVVLTDTSEASHLSQAPDDGAHLAAAPTPSLADLEGLFSRMRAAGLRLDVELGDLPELSAAAQLAVYRTVQEAMTNAIKHAPDAPVTLRLVREGTSVAVVVTNPLVGPGASTGSARGAAPAFASTGRGLIGMRQRMELVGGTVRVSEDAEAFRVEARLPARAVGVTA